MHGNLRKLVAVGATAAAVLAGGSTLAAALEAQTASTPARIATPKPIAGPITVEARKELPAVSVEQALPVSARTVGDMPVYGAWDRQTPADVKVSQPLGTIDVAQTVDAAIVPSLTVNAPAAATYNVSAENASAGVSSNVADASAAVSTTGTNLAEVSTEALGVDNKLQLARS